jgi:hypothetical protein
MPQQACAIAGAWMTGPAIAAVPMQQHCPPQEETAAIEADSPPNPSMQAVAYTISRKSDCFLLHHIVVDILQYFRFPSSFFIMKA